LIAIEERRGVPYNSCRVCHLGVIVAQDAKDEGAEIDDKAILMSGLTYLYRTCVLIFKMPAALKAMERDARPSVGRARPCPDDQLRPRAGHGVAIACIALAIVIGGAFRMGIIVPGPRLEATANHELALLHHGQQSPRDTRTTGG